MTQRSTRTGAWLWLAVVIGVLAAPWGGAAGADPATAPLGSPTSAPDATGQVDKLRSEGIAQALAGDVSGGLATLRKAAELDPRDAAATAAVDAVESYVKYRARFDNERAAEFEQARVRVDRCLLADGYFSDPADAERKKQIHKKAAETGLAYNKVRDNSDSLPEQADREQADALRTRSLAALQQTRDALAEVVRLLDADKSEYAATLRKLADRAQRELIACADAWESVDLADPKTRRQAARTLKVLERRLADALIDVDLMTIERPWRAALMQARVAKQIDPNNAGMNRLPWYRDLVQYVTDRAQAATKDARWYDALTAYSGLQQLEPDNPSFKDRATAVRRQVRIAGLYGRAKFDPDEPLPEDTVRDLNASPETPTTAQSAPAESPQPRWRDLTEGIDIDMVRTAINQLDNYYVAAVDYRKIMYSALRGLQVFADCPESAEAFPGLADPERKQRFLRAVARELSVVAAKDRLDHMNLLLALTSLERASEESVRIPTEVLAMEFADGFLDGLDKFSSMIWPRDLADFRKQTMGSFYGVGIQIAKERREPLKVMTPLANSPAFRAGMKPGDLIVAVDGQRTEDLSLEAIVRMIMGKKGTKVVLRVKRQGSVNPIDFPIIREEIRIRTIKGWRRIPGGDGGKWDYLIDPDHRIAYIRLTQFYNDTHADLARTLKDLKKMGVRSLILDLRFNPGGLLDSAKEVADEFFPSGKIVSTKGRQKREKQFLATAAGNYLEGDLVVLVNELSASAAEIVSGAVGDLDRGVIVGRRTYGKGSVQNVIPIRKDRAYLKLTTAYYYLPSGRCLHREDGEAEWGVEPNVDVLSTPRQTRRWLDIRGKTDLLRDIEPAELARDLTEQYDADIQLRTALMLLRLMQIRDKSAA
ncbi:MAG TPA: S41 family peptidase [Phycisphaerae bacterium]|nr:S41 family peptidase [Phycisphaerae bacterium]